jgi:hypothetical protein
MKGIQFCLNKGPNPIQRRNNHESAKRVGSCKYFLLKKYGARKAQIYMKALPWCIHFIIFMIPGGLRRGNNRVKPFFVCFSRKKCFKKIFSRNHALSKKS